jgi:hypothetical protein
VYIITVVPIKRSIIHTNHPGLGIGHRSTLREERGTTEEKKMKEKEKEKETHS